MSIEEFGLPAVVLIVLSTSILLVTSNWRMQIGAVGFQYLGVFILVAGYWPVNLAAVKLVAGWMAGSILGMTRLTLSLHGDGPVITGRIFRLSVALLILVTVSSLAPQAPNLAPGMDILQAWGGLVLIGMGLANLGFSSDGMRVMLSLLTLLSGFEVLYAVVESSSLVAGLLAIVTLGISLVGAYLLIQINTAETV